MTVFLNGKKITTERHLENESKYLEIEEDGKTVSIHVNGIPIYERDYNEATGNHWNYKFDKRHYCSGTGRLWTCERRRWANEWRSWAEKWRNWAEECRDWAEDRKHQKDKGCSRAGARIYQNDSQNPTVNEEHSKSNKGCPQPGRRHPPFSMSGERKPDLNQRQCKTNNGQPWPEENLTRPDMGYFVFPKPGEKSIRVNKTQVRKNKKQHRPEVGQPVSDKDNAGFSKPGEGHADQDVRTNKGQPKSDKACSHADKEHHGSQRPDEDTCACKESNPVHSGSFMKQKMTSGCSSQDGNKKDPVRRLDQQTEESKQQATKSEGPLGKNEQRNVKLEGENGETTLRSGQEKRKESHQVKKKAAAHVKQVPKPQLTTRSAKGPPLKRKESQVQVRKSYSKWTKSQIGRRKMFGRRNTSQAWWNRIPNKHSKADIEWNGPSTKNKEVISEKKFSIDCKQGSPSRKKCPLPPLQELSVLAKQRLLRRRVHHLPSETRDKKHLLISETNLPMNANSQQRGRVITLPRNISRLPSIRGQKLKTNQLTKLIH